MTGRGEPEEPSQQLCRILSLDGGGAKGFYSLGVLKEIEALVKQPLCEHFDLIFGTSTGAIIAALAGLGKSVDEVHSLYQTHVPAIMRQSSRKNRSAALAKLADTVFADASFHDFKTAVGLVATNWLTERPMIFKNSVDQAHGRKGTFTPGFGVSVPDAVQASCSAYPFFERKKLNTTRGEVELFDGGFCANNPTLYAITDALHALRQPASTLRVVSVGVGVYPQPRYGLFRRIVQGLSIVELLQKTLEVNTQSMEQLRSILHRDIQTVRISDTFERPDMATDLMEHELRKLNILWQRGSESFATREDELRSLLLSPE